MRFWTCRHQDDGGLCCDLDNFAVSWLLAPKGRDNRIVGYLDSAAPGNQYPYAAHLRPSQKVVLGRL